MRFKLKHNAEVYNLQILDKDDRDDIPTNCVKGVYFIYKKNCIAQCGWGGNRTYKAALEANTAAKNYLNKRKDRDSLSIRLLLC